MASLLANLPSLGDSGVQKTTPPSAGISPTPQQSAASSWVGAMQDQMHNQGIMVPGGVGERPSRSSVGGPKAAPAAAAPAAKPKTVPDLETGSADIKGDAGTQSGDTRTR